MKAQRRHELQTNVLADWLAHKIEEIRPYGKTLAGIVVIIAALLFAMSFLSGQRTRDATAGWTRYFEASAERDAGAMRNVADNFPASPAAAWARLSAADIDLAEGGNLLYSDRNAAMERLRQARDDYQKVLEVAVEPLQKQRALFGLGLTQEALDNLPEARQAYEQLVSQWPDSALGGSAKQRLDYLAQADTEQFFSWFFAQQPAITPPEENAPRGPSLFDDLPDDPDLSLPGPLERAPRDASDASGDIFLPLDAPAPGDTGPAEAGEKPPAQKESSAEQPAREERAEEKPAEEKPAEEKPAEEKPAEEKPAEEKPAEDQPAKEERAGEKPADAAGGGAESAGSSE